MYPVHRSKTPGLVRGLMAGLGIALIGTPALAAGFSEGAPGDWLSRYTSARTLGLGGAFVAAVDQPIGAVWNPAGLTNTFRNQVQFETARLFEGTSVNGLSFGVPAQTFPSFAVTVLSLSSGDIERTSELNEPLGTFGESDFAFLLTASKAIITPLSVGANLKVYRQSLEEFDATGIGADLGVTYDITPTLRAGASLLNLGGPNLTLRDTQESLPAEFRGGLALTTLSGRALLSTELNTGSGEGTLFRAGAEVWVHQKMAVRAGLYEESLAGGLSFRPTSAMQVDYGLADRELGVTHRLGVSFSFGGFFAKSEAVPRVFSPVGQKPVTKFHLRARTKSETTEWDLAIVDKFSQVVRQFGGRGVPPAHLVWDGKDETGLPLPDGEYRYRLTVRDAEGREMEGGTQVVEISTGGPEGTVPTIVG